jgi:hypothetical protein
MEMKDPMFLRLKQLAARLLGRMPPLPPHWPGPSEDPYAGVREPKHRKPGGRTSAVAVREPDSDHAV